MILVLVLVVWAIAFLADYRDVYKHGRPVVRWVCAALLLIGVAVQALHELQVPVPSPAPPIAEFVTHILNLR